MSMKINHELPLPEVLKSQYPLSQELKEVKKQRDEETVKRLEELTKTFNLRPNIY